MSISFLLPNTPCCGELVFWDEVQLKLPCVKGEYFLPVPGDATEMFVEGLHELMRTHNATEHGMVIGLHFWATYGRVEAPGSVGRHSGHTPGPVRTRDRCQCMGVAHEGSRLLKRQCDLGATAGDRWRTCRPCREFCKILVPNGANGFRQHRAPLTVQRGRFN